MDDRDACGFGGCGAFADGAELIPEGGSEEYERQDKCDRDRDEDAEVDSVGR